MNRKKTAKYRTECINILTIIEARQNLEQLDLGYKAVHHALQEIAEEDIERRKQLREIAEEDKELLKKLE